MGYLRRSYQSVQVIQLEGRFGECRPRKHVRPRYPSGRSAHAYSRRTALLMRGAEAEFGLLHRGDEGSRCASSGPYAGDSS